ncbi:transketolase [Aneurinibacillus aneurinilyticus]|jgi:transketolase|uniref:Transketolase n=2 Tax=Aneurinibacillus aneurinilyticus TaxID=1391 RepID=A0A848D1P7_ANEAE|nr:transketolase [Aneurinibacillus aneurinilyticus]ERI04524.1 Transketolase, thiamine diphosphate binding domain protein [Aneurinibacillus aneurinilyticus ATCC 12856]MCI1693945.1 transketolase [Aneurinibacillus aneurinilyticus]MED0670781.1 transketolase [Aneurinibacillus aneurinilyticus]MED0706473.1 transketolase [Aneurinibacillus aneurinilyticus]MED0721396.1 transketolase [Aneurinibacillus aneurinilyticus]
MSTVTEGTLTELKQHANNIRQEIVKMVAAANSGHPGGSLSAADILSVLYFHEMNVGPDKVTDPDRDRFVLSKGHASPVLYASLAEKGYLPKEELATFRKINSRLQGHPSKKMLPGVEQSTGSLGQGLSAANGMALAARLDKRDYRVYALLGDGEIQEGMVWEAAMAAGHYKLDNLVAILDYNHLQIDGNVEDIMNVGPVADKFRAFNWHVIEIDGHNLEEIIAALDEAKSVKGMPTFIVAHTVKGKGVSYMENACGWHGTAPNAEQLAQALEELCGQGGEQ